MSYQDSEQLRSPSIAEMVANVLRNEILDGKLREGDVLPAQDELLRRFGVSKPSMREALRMLEAEGLVTVRRGNQGGATVHAPTERNAARAISLVLQAERVSLQDVGVALVELEPLCAALCAARQDRADAVVPRLRERHEAACRAAGDGLEFTRAARLFHEEVVSCCGNRTLILIVGALESLWAGSEERWAEQATEDGGFPSVEHRNEGNRAHEKLIELIEAGDVAATTSVARRHLHSTQRYALSGGVDSPVLLQNVSP